MQLVRPVIYYRPKLLVDQELSSCSDRLIWTDTRLSIKSGDLVIPRFTVLPILDEFYRDMAIIGAQVVNNRRQHHYLADIGCWYPDLQDVTPETWASLDQVPLRYRSDPFVVKGATNSRKDLWQTHMYANCWNDAGKVLSLLSQDSLVGSQSLYVRRYVPLKFLGRTITGLPMSKEFRFFVLYGQLVAGGFYWTDFSDDIIEQGYEVPDVSIVPRSFLDDVIDVVKERANFFVVDVAQDVNDRWHVIELNDGQQSGLQGIDPFVLYDGIASICETHRE